MKGENQNLLARNMEGGNQNIVIEFPPNGEEEHKPTTVSKDKLMEYVGVWVKGVGGNNPVMLVLPEMREKVKEIAQALWPDTHILASIQMPERKLITRKNIHSIQQYGVNILSSLLESEAISDNKAKGSKKAAKA